MKRTMVEETKMNKVEVKVKEKHLHAVVTILNRLPNAYEKMDEELYGIYKLTDDERQKVLRYV